MLAKSKRLTRAQFEICFKTGKRLHTGTFTLIVLREGPFHGSVVVGKKVYIRAHDRNRLRRRIYGILSNTAKSTGTYVVITKPPAANVPYCELKGELQAALLKLV